MFSLKTTAGVFAQLTAEEAFGLVVFNVVIAPTAAPAVGLAKLAPAAGRINRTAELGDIDEGFDHQHRMAVSALPIGGKPIQGQAQHLARQVGHGTLGQDKESAVVSHQTEATVALCSAPSDPLVSMLEVLGWSAEDQQGQPLTLGIGGHVVEALAHRFEASQIVMCSSSNCLKRSSSARSTSRTWTWSNSACSSQSLTHATHAREGKKSQCKCPAERFFSFSLNGIPIARHWPYLGAEGLWSC